MPRFRARKKSDLAWVRFRIHPGYSDLNGLLPIETVRNTATSGALNVFRPSFIGGGSLSTTDIDHQTSVFRETVTVLTVRGSVFAQMNSGLASALLADPQMYLGAPDITSSDPLVFPEVSQRPGDYPWIGEPMLPRTYAANAGWVGWRWETRSKRVCRPGQALALRGAAASTSLSGILSILFKVS